MRRSILVGIVAVTMLAMMPNVGESNGRVAMSFRARGVVGGHYNYGNNFAAPAFFAPSYSYGGYSAGVAAAPISYAAPTNCDCYTPPAQVFPQPTQLPAPTYAPRVPIAAPLPSYTPSCQPQGGVTYAPSLAPSYGVQRAFATPAFAPSYGVYGVQRSFVNSGIYAAPAAAVFSAGVYSNAAFGVGVQRSFFRARGVGVGVGVGAAFAPVVSPYAVGGVVGVGRTSGVIRQRSVIRFR